MKHTATRLAASAIAVTALGLTLAACSSSSSGTKDTGQPLADIPTLSGQSTAVKLDTGFTSALSTLKLTPGVIGTAKLTDGSLVFPITGGNVKYYTPGGKVEPFVQGSIKHEGSGFSLTGGATTVSLTNFTVDPGKSELYGDVAANGKTVATQTTLFDLDGSTLQALQTSGDTAILQGTTVHISAGAATLLDSTFKTDAVKGGLLIGVATITVNTK